MTATEWTGQERDTQHRSEWCPPRRTMQIGEREISVNEFTCRQNNGISRECGGKLACTRGVQGDTQHDGYCPPGRQAGIQPPSINIWVTVDSGASVGHGEEKKFRCIRGALWLVVDLRRVAVSCANWRHRNPFQAESYESGLDNECSRIFAVVALVSYIQIAPHQPPLIPTAAALVHCFFGSHHWHCI